MLGRPLASRLPGATVLLALTLLIAGCGSRADPAEIQLAAQKTCISDAINDAVLKSQDDDATLAALDRQNLNECPSDFVAAFVALRTSVRDHLQTQREILAHNGKANDAAKGDLINLGCSILAGKQCAPSAIDDWMNIDGKLKARDATDRAAYQKAMATVETVIAQYGVYIRQLEPAPSLSIGNVS